MRSMPYPCTTIVFVATMMVARLPCSALEHAIDPAAGWICCALQRWRFTADVWLLLSFLCIYIKNISFKLYRSTSQQHRKDEFKYQLLIALFKIQIVFSFEALINENKENHNSCQKCLYIGRVQVQLSRIENLTVRKHTRGYVLKNATQTHAHTDTHTTVFIHLHTRTPQHATACY